MEGHHSYVTFVTDPDVLDELVALRDDAKAGRQPPAEQGYRVAVAAPSYLARHGRPSHPLRLTEHRCIGYASTVGDTWHFSHEQGDTATVRPTGPLRVNNGDAMMPLLVAGSGLGILPDFIIRATRPSSANGRDGRHHAGRS